MYIILTEHFLAIHISYPYTCSTSWHSIPIISYALLAVFFLQFSSKVQKLKKSCFVTDMALVCQDLKHMLSSLVVHLPWNPCKVLAPMSTYDYLILMAIENLSEFSLNQSSFWWLVHPCHIEQIVTSIGFASGSHAVWVHWSALFFVQ